MIPVLNPHGYIDRLWGKQKIEKDTSYRLIKYVLRFEYDGNVILHNTVTGKMVKLDKEDIQILDKMPAYYNPLMEELIADHFLVPEYYDEYKSVNQLRKICQCSSGGDAINHYIILPTTFCNAHCFYCYESDYPRVQMTKKTADKLIDFIDKQRKGKNVTINWFGGEPLVAIHRIDQISQGLKDRGISLTSSMISNGYLFDEEIVKRSVDLWELKRIQITLDGTEETYNRVKAYVNIKDNPFWRVLRNIDLLSKYKVQVNIRLNVDFYNRDDVLKLIEMLGERYSENNYVMVYVNMLFNNQGYEPVNHSYDDLLKLSEIIDEYTKRLKELNLSVDNGKYLSLEFSHCMADNPHSIQIQPDGSFSRCEHESVLDSYGSLEKGIVNPQKIQDWKKAVEPSESCRECPLYPTCYHLRDCMNSDVPCTDALQLRNIKKQTDRIRTMYISLSEVKKNERV